MKVAVCLDDRAGMGFETLECLREVRQCLENAHRNGAFLVDSVTSLVKNYLGNNIYMSEKAYEKVFGDGKFGDVLIAFRVLYYLFS